MKLRKKNSLIILTILIIVVLAGSIYSFAVQRKAIIEKTKRLQTLKENYASIDAIKLMLKEFEKDETVVDTLLASFPVNIPQALPEEKFYDFVNRYSNESSIYTGTSVEFKDRKTEGDFNCLVYRIYGTGQFTDVYDLVYAIEHSRELKKIESAEVKANTVVNSRGIPKYLISFDILVDVYSANTGQFISSKPFENNFEPRDICNAYYPLIRNEIPPNTEGLPDIQNAMLISLVPQGAFIQVNQGDTFLMEKGDAVYLGYLTDIDYSAGTVTFTLNKGGLIEEMILQLGNRKNRGK